MAYKLVRQKAVWMEVKLAWNLVGWKANLKDIRLELMLVDMREMHLVYLKAGLTVEC